MITYIKSSKSNLKFKEIIDNIREELKNPLYNILEKNQRISKVPLII